jgi:cytochrome c peroxidase
MWNPKPKWGATIASAVALMVAACGSPVDGGELGQSAVSATALPLTVQDRLTACAADPRVIAGLVSPQICAGADIFFRETFSGNGRACGTCHPMSNNTTIDANFVAALRNTNPSDPLFVAEQNPALASLERSADLNRGGIVENVDGLEDPTNKFVVRSVPHVLSLATSLAADVGDGTTNPPLERTGWGGDGSPGDGSLRSFLTGAITQHYTKGMARSPGVDFRLPTSDELDLVAGFQLTLGRTNELDLSQVNLFDADANEGRRAFLDPQRGRCNVCHMNAGANSIDTGRNRNFNTGTELAQSFSVSQFDGVFLFDGGFGGQGLAHPNVMTLPLPDGKNNGFGNNTFNTPPLIEAADTGPFFHTNTFGPRIEDAVFFYLGLFQSSQAARDLEARFGTPLNFTGDDGFRMGRFLRALNVAFNLDLAKQRLRAALTLARQLPNSRVDIQIGLLNLAENELDDAIEVLTDSNTAQPFYPVSVERIGFAKAEIAAARAASNSARAGSVSNAVSRVESARDPIGSNITFQLGQGNLMF